MVSDYIETRPEAIEAIKKAINDKWNPICMGYFSRDPQMIPCELCGPYRRGVNTTCDNCPLMMAYGKERTGVFACTQHYADWSHSVYGHAEAEAMLEALVMLLAPEHRTEFGG